MTRPDVLIVGGGVAGSLCAQHLAAAGARVLLADARGTAGGAAEVLSGRGGRLFGPLSCSGIAINEVVSLWNGDAVIHESSMTSPWGSGLAIDRAAFDVALRSAAVAAGATLIVASARRAEPTRRGWGVTLVRGSEVQTAEASMLVLANGRSGHALVPRRSSGTKELAVIARVSEEIDARLYVERTPGGWWYALPHPAGGGAIGFCTTTRRRGEPLRAFWRREWATTRLIRSLASDESIAAISSRAAGIRSFDAVAGPRWLAIGDAAFACDPLSGMGLELAAETALRAATAVTSASPAEYAGWVGEWAADHRRISARLRG